jgi:hypothetical protein
MTQLEKNKQPEAPPPRRNRTEIVGRDAGAVGASAFARAGFADPALVLRWADIVGSEVARIARPIRLTENATGGVLTVLSEPAAALFLQHESRALCERINTYLGHNAVAKLRFIQGSLQMPRKLPANPQLPSHAPTNDPARQFQGSERLQGALLSLARVRGTRQRNTSD